MDILREAYEREYLKGSSLYKEESTIINGIKGLSFFYHWDYNGHDINVVSWFTIQPKMAYIVSRIIPQVILNKRVTEADKVVSSFRSSLSNTIPVKKEVVPNSVLPKKPVTTISLMPEKSNFIPGNKITVKFSGLPAKGQDWLALSAVNHKADEYFDTVMLQGKPQSGAHSFTGLPEGDYEIRAYTNWPDGGYTITAKTGISVKKASATPKVPVAIPASPKKPIVSTPTPAKPIVQKPAKPVDTIVDVVTNTPKNSVVKSKGQRAQIPETIQIPHAQIPPINASDAPLIDSWSYYSLGSKSMEEILSLINYPKEAHGQSSYKNWVSYGSKTGPAEIIEYLDNENKKATNEKRELGFYNGKLNYIRYKKTNDKTDNKYIKINFAKKYVIASLIIYYDKKGKLHRELDGPSYYYTSNGILHSIMYYKNDKRNGISVKYRDGKISKMSGFKNDKHTFEIGYKEGIIKWSKIH